MPHIKAIRRTTIQKEENNDGCLGVCVLIIIGLLAYINFG